MITILLIIIALYFLLGYGGYIKALTYCIDSKDEIALKAFRSKIILNWIQYAYTIGKIRREVIIVQIEDELLNRTRLYPEDANSTTVDLFSKCFTGLEREGSAIFASYVVEPEIEDEEDEEDEDNNTDIWNNQQ